MQFGLRSRNVLTSKGLDEAVILVNDETIKNVLPYNAAPDCEVKDCGDLIIMPGIIDTHVHINEPGRDWEGFETATKAAAAGGITMLVDMPLNSMPVTTTVDAFNRKLEASKNKLYVDCGFYGGIIPGNQNELQGLIENGVLGLKAFMIFSGVKDFPEVSEEDLRKALSVLKKIETKVPVLVHAEIECGSINYHDQYSFESFLKTRPREWENKAIELLIKLSREFDYHVHIVHLSSSDAVRMIRDAKSEGLKITTETCPHYLYFSSEEIPDKDTRFKCTPPIRENQNREILWDAVKEGVVDFIVSDHSPCLPEMKSLDEGNFEKAWGGISSLQLGLSIIWTEARKRGLNIERISELMSRNTAGFIGMGNSKGKLEEGFDADIIIFDSKKNFIVNAEKLYHRHKVTPYTGRELTGKVVETFLRGREIFKDEKIISKPKGKAIISNKHFIGNHK